MQNIIFEEIRKVDKSGKEFWSARDLYPLFGYLSWENFLTAIERAKEACENSGQKLGEHLRGATKQLLFGNSAQKEYSDFNMTRYFCYLVAQNGDPRKIEIAKAQTYFAIKTRQKEIEDILIEDQKRVYARNELTIQNRNLARTAKYAGVKNFANFQDAGYMGLYGGLRQKEIKKRKGLSEEENLLDNRKMGERVRQFVKDGGGAMPENLPKSENIKNSKKRLKTKNKKLLKNK